MIWKIWNFGKSRSFPAASGSVRIPHGCSITTENPELVETLRRHSRLKIEVKETAIEDMTKSELLEKATSLNIAGVQRKRKAELIAILSEV